MAIGGIGNMGYYHISTGKDYSVKELFDGLLDSLNFYNTPIHDMYKDLQKNDIEIKERGEDDVYTILIDPSKTNIDFNWSPKTKLVDGIKSATKWYIENEINETYTHLKIK